MKQILKSGLGISIAIGGAQATGMLRHEGTHPFISNYLHDVTLPMGGTLFLIGVNKILDKIRGEAFFTNKLEREYDNMLRAFVGANYFVLASAGEIAQKFGLYSGTYDPYDFVAYAAGVGAAIGIDVLLSRNKNELEEKVEK